MEITNKRKADEDQQEQPEKRSIDQLERYVEELKAGAERRAGENKRAKIGGDVDGGVMREEIGAM